MIGWEQILKSSINTSPTSNSICIIYHLSWYKNNAVSAKIHLEVSYLWWESRCLVYATGTWLTYCHVPDTFRWGFSRG